MKLVNEEIQVMTTEKLPSSLTWRNQTWTVEAILNSWRIDGRWWLDIEMKGTTRRYYRLRIVCGRSERVVEVYWESGGGWIMGKVLD